ncbi:MAG TPA: leucine-rich repeat domain-containing protein, partial [Clostridia bacterium]|nr:leucine-rich repeat domain-containing protein [Clostridia bacterium]
MKNSLLKRFVALFTLTFILFSAGCSCSFRTGEKELVVFKDAIFEKLIKEELQKDTIYTDDLSDIKGIQILADKYIFLSGSGRPEKDITLYGDDTFEYEEQKYTGFGTIKTLDDLKNFPALTVLKVFLQPETDYSTIPSIEKLERITISQSKLKDITFLSNAVNIASLTLSTNNISDISALGSCTKLTFLSVDFNDVSDITVLSKLTQLKRISFYSNKISDLSPLKDLTSLEDIALYNNKIQDISALSGLTNLKKIELINNKIEDVSPLKDFSSFEELRLSGNPIKN